MNDALATTSRADELIAELTPRLREYYESGGSVMLVALAPEEPNAIAIGVYANHTSILVRLTINAIRHNFELEDVLAGLALGAPETQKKPIPDAQMMEVEREQ